MKGHIKQERELEKEKLKLSKKAAKEEIEEVDRNIKEIDDAQEEMESLSLKPFSKDIERKPYGDELLNTGKAQKLTSQNVYSAAPVYEKTLLVDRFWQRQTGVDKPYAACGPTVGAMIMDYYHDVRGLNIKDSTFYPHPYDTNLANFINHMAFDMLRQSRGHTIFIKKKIA